MLAFIKSSGLLRERLRYNEQKVDKAAASLLYANGFLLEATKLSFNHKLSVLKNYAERNNRAKRKTVHITLMFNRSDKEKLSKQVLTKSAKHYMGAIGFEKQPYLVYQHLDSWEPHLHILSVNIDKKGQYIRPFAKGENLSIKACREIENIYGLKTGPDASAEIKHEQKNLPIQRLEYGKVASLEGISNLISQVIKEYQFRSLSEFNLILNQFGVWVSGGKPGSLLNQNKGLIYGFLNEKGKSVGAPIKASLLKGKPILKNLAPHFEKSKEETYYLMEGTRRFLDKALYDADSTVESIRLLRQYGIRILFKASKQGQVHGVNFLDNNIKCVLNDQDLGSDYNVQSLQEILGLNIPSHSTSSLNAASENKENPEESLDLNENQSSILAYELPVVKTLIEEIDSDPNQSSDKQASIKQKKEMVLEAQDLGLSL